jgi:hypothetical protein
MAPPAGLCKQITLGICIMIMQSLCIMIMQSICIMIMQRLCKEIMQGEKILSVKNMKKGKGRATYLIISWVF